MRQHDPFLKRLYKAGARDAVALFFPDLAAHIDWDKIEWIDKEVPIEGAGADTRSVVADLLGLTRDVEGKYLEVLIHPEIQMQRERDMDWRVLQYNTGMVLQRRSADTRVITFVFYHCGGAGGIRKQRYVQEFYGETLLEVGYWSVGLGDLKAEEYAETDNPMAWALASWMRKPRKGRVQLRLRLLERILRFVREPGYRRLLLDTVRTYFALNAAQKAEEERMLQSSRYGEVREMFKTEFERLEEEAERRGRERALTEFGRLEEEAERRGRERALTEFGRLEEEAERRGRERALTEFGRLEEEVERRARVHDKQDVLLQLMGEKFGSVPEWASARVRGLRDAQALDRLLRKLIHADDLAAMGLQ